MEWVGGFCKVWGFMDSRQKFTDDASIDVGDAIITSLMTIGEVFVVETEKVEDVAWRSCTGATYFSEA